MKTRLMALAFGSWLASTAAQAAPAEAAQPYAVRYPNIQWFDPVYIADHKGWFREEGIQIQWVGEVPAAQLVPAVASRTIDFANRMTPLVLTAIQGGAKLKLVAAGARTTKDHPHMKYLVLPQSGVQSVKDLRGLKVGINSFGACSEYVLKEYLKRSGVDRGVEFAVVSDAHQEQALKTGLIDVAVLHSPYYEKLVKTGGAREIFNDYVVDEGLSGMLPYFTNEALIRERPDVVRAFVKVLVRTTDWVNANPDEAAAIFALKRGLEPQYAGAWRFYEHGLIQDAPVKWWIDYLEREGPLKKGSVKLADVYTNEFNPFQQKHASR